LLLVGVLTIHAGPMHKKCTLRRSDQPSCCLLSTFGNKTYIFVYYFNTIVFYGISAIRVSSNSIMMQLLAASAIPYTNLHTPYDLGIIIGS
jgi:hypothetical protein